MTSTMIACGAYEDHTPPKAVMEWMPRLNGIVVCQNGEVSPSNEEFCGKLWQSAEGILALNVVIQRVPRSV